MKVRQVAQVPPPTVSPASTVREAVAVMERSRGGAVVVVDGARLVGVLSERDVMLRVVGAGRDPDTTPVAEVMTADVATVSPETSMVSALELMVERHVRHLPVLADDGAVWGFVSIRNLLQSHVEFLADQLRSLESFITADGPGG
jgi:CBS domain-containing protein